MKVTLKVEKEFDIKYLHVSANVRYWEDAIVDGEEDTDGDRIPCRVGNTWRPRINIEEGKIINWIQGTTAQVHYKVCDEGMYILVDSNYETVITKDGYVPRIMCPKENGYGDYIIMDIDENGFIQNWMPYIDDFNIED